MVITLAFAAYMGGAVMNQVSATTETTAAKAATCQTDKGFGSWYLSHCSDVPGSNSGRNMVWLIAVIPTNVVILIVQKNTSYPMPDSFSYVRHSLVLSVVILQK